MVLAPYLLSARRAFQASIVEGRQLFAPATCHWSRSDEHLHPLAWHPVKVIRVQVGSRSAGAAPLPSSASCCCSRSSGFALSCLCGVCLPPSQFVYYYFYRFFCFLPLSALISMRRRPERVLGALRACRAKPAQPNACDKLRPHLSLAPSCFSIHFPWPPSISFVCKIHFPYLPDR